MTEAASQGILQLYTSWALLVELAEVLSRPNLAAAVAAARLTPAALVAQYRRLVHVVAVRRLARQVSRDADDDMVLACALAAKANLIVSGDADLLTLRRYRDIPIVTPAEAVQRLIP